RLAKRSPEAYAPHLWRQYLDTLLRYERLLRAGGEASSVRGQVDKLQEQIAAEGQRLGIDATSLSLALPAAFGQPAVSEELQKRFEELWDSDAKDDQFRGPIEALIGKTVEQRLALLRLSR